jgi:hypothetical protein
MLMPRRRLSLSIAGVLGLAWGTPAGAAEPRRGGTLRIAYEAGMDPRTSLGVQAMHVERNLSNTLVTIDRNDEFVPDLAAAWEVQEGGRVVKFHDGTEVTAAAVQWDADRLLNPQAKAISARFFEPIVAAVDVIDQPTLRLRLTYPASTLLPALAIDWVGFMSVSPAAYKSKQQLAPRPTGSGSFTLGRWEQTRLIALERHPDYFERGLPYKANALVKAAGFDERRPLESTPMTHAGLPAPAHRGHGDEDAAGIVGVSAGEGRGDRSPHLPQTPARARLRPGGQHGPALHRHRGPLLPAGSGRRVAQSGEPSRFPRQRAVREAAARDDVRGYSYLKGMKVSCGTAWLAKER